MDFYAYVYGCIHPRKKRSHSVGFLTFVCNRHHLTCLYLNLRGSVFVAQVIASFLGCQFPAVGLRCHLAFGICDFLPSNGFCLYGWFVHYPLDVCSHSRLKKLFNRWEPVGSAWCGPDPTMFYCCTC